jgi:DNA-binding protein H-NS
MNRLTRIRQQIANLERQAERLQKSSIVSVVAQIKRLMVEHGISLADIQGGVPGRERRPPAKTKRGRPTKVQRGRLRPAKPGPQRKAKGPRQASAPAKKGIARKTRRPPKPKYRSTANKQLTWSGRGRSPAWVREWVGSGKKLDDLLIK